MPITADNYSLCPGRFKEGRLRFIEKRVVDFLLVLIELFSLGVKAEGLRSSEYWFKIGDFAPTGTGWPKIWGWRDRPHQPFFLSEN